MIAVDTSVLVSAHRREATGHRCAALKLRELAEGAARWAIPWPCVYEFFAVVTDPRIWRSASTQAQAWTQIEAWRGSPSLHLLAEPADFGETLAPLLLRTRVRGAVVHDARIAALCLVHGVEGLLTRDRDLSLFPELALIDPFAES